jgi:hypothetical protein
MIELINSVKPTTESRGKVESQYRVAKMMLGWEIEAAVTSVDSILRGPVRAHIGDFVKILRRYNKIVKHLDKHAARTTT